MQSEVSFKSVSMRVCMCVCAQYACKYVCVYACMHYAYVCAPEVKESKTNMYVYTVHPICERSDAALPNPNLTWAQPETESGRNQCQVMPICGNRAKLCQLVPVLTA